MICRSSSCQICSCEVDEVPSIWQQESHHDKIKLEIEEKFSKWTEKFNFNSEQWLLDDDVDPPEGSFVNLLKNPEGFTGYKGTHIWKAIFSENCFADKLINLCTEDLTFYRIFSGWLSNTNMQIGMNFHDLKTNRTFINVPFIITRLLNNKERIDNLFFLYSLMVKAVHKAKDVLLNYDYHSGNNREDANAINLLNELYDGNYVDKLNDLFNETNDDFENFMHSKKTVQLITRFRNISSIIDCVTCSKCRMHSKLEVFGMATMLKIMFANSDQLKEKIRRNELVSFVNLFAKLSKTVSNIFLIYNNIKHGKQHKKIKIGLYIITFIVSFLMMNFVALSKKSKKENIQNNTPKEKPNLKKKRE
ncbi:MAG: ERO1 family protein [archaeon]|nr:ERO1 family protein [archaeon]